MSATQEVARVSWYSYLFWLFLFIVVVRWLYVDDVRKIK